MHNHDNASEEFPLPDLKGKRSGKVNKKKGEYSHVHRAISGNMSLSSFELGMQYRNHHHYVRYADLPPLHPSKKIFSQAVVLFWFLCVFFTAQ